MMKRLNLVIANNLGTGVESLQEACRNADIVFDSVKQLNDKKLLASCLENSGDTVTALIVFDDLSGEKITLQEMKRYHGLINAQAVMIPVFTDAEVGSSFAKQVLDAGLYNSIFCGRKSASRQQTVSVSDVKARLQYPYQYKDALKYFRIADTKAFGNVTEDEKESVKRAAKYLRSYNGTQSDLLSKLTDIEGRMPGMIPDVLSGATDSMLRQLTGVPDYDLLSRSILQKRKQSGFDENEYDDDEEEDEEKAKKKRSASDEKLRKAVNDIKGRGEKILGKSGFGKKERERRPRKDGLRKTSELAFISTNIGVGCTCNAVMCAFSLNRSGHKTAIVELDGEDENFKFLCRTVKGTEDVGACTTFSFGGVDFFFGMRLSDFKTGYAKNYEYIIYDSGCLPDGDIRSLSDLCDVVFVATRAEEYKRGEFLDFLADVQKIDTGRKFVYLFSDSDEADIRELRALMPRLRMEAVPHNRNPYNPKRKIRKMFMTLADGEYVPKKAGKPSGKGISAKLKESSEESLVPLLIGCGAVLILACAAMSAVISGKNADMEELRAAAVAEIQKRDDNIESLSADISEAEAEAEALMRTVIVFKEPVAAGTKISGAGTEEKEICSGLPSDIYATAEDIKGKYITCDMMPGVPIYRCNLADRVEEALPYEVEHPTEAQTEETAGTEDGGDAE